MSEIQKPEVEYWRKFIPEKKERKARVKIRGKKPMLMNPMTDQILDELHGSGKKAVIKGAEAVAVAALKVYREDGKIGLPSSNLLACLREGGKKVEIGKRQKITKANGETLLYTFLSIDEDFLPLLDIPQTENDGWVVDRRRGVIPASGAAVCIIRPKFMTWSLEFTVTFDEAKFKEETVIRLIHESGTGGLGDFRGPFGQFEIENWEILAAAENQKPAAA